MLYNEVEYKFYFSREASVYYNIRERRVIQVSFEEDVIYSLFYLSYLTILSINQFVMDVKFSYVILYWDFSATIEIQNLDSTLLHTLKMWV